jgi:hypothetical protein
MDIDLPYLSMIENFTIKVILIIFNDKFTIYVHILLNVHIHIPILKINVIIGVHGFFIDAHKLGILIKLGLR